MHVCMYGDVHRYIHTYLGCVLLMYVLYFVVVSLEGEPRMLLAEVLLHGMDRIVNAPSSAVNGQKSNRLLLLLLSSMRHTTL